MQGSVTHGTKSVVGLWRSEADLAQQQGQYNFVNAEWQRKTLKASSRGYGKDIMVKAVKRSRIHIARIYVIVEIGFLQQDG